MYLQTSLATFITIDVYIIPSMLLLLALLLWGAQILSRDIASGTVASGATPALTSALFQLAAIYASCMLFGAMVPIITNIVERCAQVNLGAPPVFNLPRPNALSAVVGYQLDFQSLWYTQARAVVAILLIELVDMDV